MADSDAVVIGRGLAWRSLAEPGGARRSLAEPGPCPVLAPCSFSLCHIVIAFSQGLVLSSLLRRSMPVRGRGLGKDPCGGGVRCLPGSIALSWVISNLTASVFTNLSSASTMCLVGWVGGWCFNCTGVHVTELGAFLGYRCAEGVSYQRPVFSPLCFQPKRLFI